MVKSLIMSPQRLMLEPSKVINRKIWRDITKGLNLPASITSAAFTLRTQYMKVSVYMVDLP